MIQIPNIISNAASGKPSLYKSGDKYSRLLLTGKSFTVAYKNSTKRHLECICDCGSILWVEFSSLRQENTRSCGCLVKDTLTKHGMSSKDFTHPIYKAWQSMKERCYNPNAHGYEHYGGRGITICDEWVNDFNIFKEWSLLNGWQYGLSLDRFPDNNGNYHHLNCRWATNIMQSRNRRSNYILEAFGEKKCIAEWVVDSRCSVTQAAIKYRLTILNWPSEKAIGEPAKRIL